MADTKYVTIGGAARILGTSIDTIRRWEKAGRLRSERLDGKNRFFEVSELKAFMHVQKLSTGQVAELLNVSVTTVRRLQSSGMLQAETDEHGKRWFSKGEVEEYRQLGKTGAWVKPTFETKEEQITSVKPLAVKDLVAPEVVVVPGPLQEVKPESVKQLQIQTPVTPKAVAKPAIHIVEVQYRAEIDPSNPVPTSKPVAIKQPKTKPKRLQRHYAANKDIYKSLVAFVAMVSVIAWLILSS